MFKKIKCPNCNGIGREQRIIDRNGEEFIENICALCNGTGFLECKYKKTEDCVVDPCNNYHQVMNRREHIFEVCDDEYY